MRAFPYHPVPGSPPVGPRRRTAASPTRRRSTPPGPRSGAPTCPSALVRLALLVPVVCTLVGPAGFVRPEAVFAQFPAVLEGRVLDRLTGEPVAGARITAGDAGPIVRSDGDGSFRLRGLEEGVVRVSAAAPGYLPGEWEVEVRNGRVTRHDLPLAPRVVALEALEVEVPRHEGVVLDRAAVRRSGARTVGELLEGLPGVVVRRQGPGGAEEVLLRGAGGDQVLVLVDGVAVNDPLTGTADLGTLPISEVAGVRVLPGARAARYGPGALGGVILVDTGAGAGHAGLEGKIGAGSLDDFGGSVSSSAPLGPLRATFDVGVRTLGGGFRFDRGEPLGGGTDRRRNSDLRHLSLRGSVSDPGPEARWRLHASAERLARGVPGKAYAPSDSARQERSRVALQARWRGSLGPLPLDLAAHHVHQGTRFRDPAPPLGIPFDERARLRSAGFDAEVPARRVLGEAGASDLRVGGGASLRHQSIRADQLDGPGAVRRLDAAAFVHAETTLPRLPGGPGLAGALRLHRDGNGGDWLVAHDLTVRLDAGPFGFHVAHRSSFSPPTAGDQYFREGVGVRPNPELRAERVPSETEIGGRIDLARGPVGLRLAGEYFRGDIRDMILWSPDFRFVWSPRNEDVARRGWELRASVRHAGAGVRAGGHVSRTDVTYRRGGAAPPVQVIYRPRDSGGAFVGWGRAGLELELRAAYVGVRHPVAARVNALPAFWTFDVTASGSWILAGWRVRPTLRVERLFDEREPFIHAFPEPGRTIRLELGFSPPRPFDSRP